tara:strand:- start:3444 stop:3782 length:339 start_codon:yes stop_codon:yes gene_type:complete
MDKYEYQCIDCDTVYITSENKPPPTPRWSDNHKCELMRKNSRIVKVQQSLYDSEYDKSILITDENNNYNELSMAEDMEPVLELIGSRNKVYFEANLVNGKFELLNEISPQNF